ncbi:MAG: hypothetical protein ACI9OJ_002298, partial [Myxococcota bacterium]
AQLERASVYNYGLDDGDAASLMTDGDACDGEDNDCDGTTDEDYPTKLNNCDGADADICEDGKLTCTSNRLALECTGEVDDMELCDGADNDCDGLTDEDFPGLGDLCDGVDPDVCENGTVTCKVDGSGSECLGDLNQPEFCDGLDNDCNGVADDNLTGMGAACDDVDTDQCTDGVTYCDSVAGAVKCDEIHAVVWTPLDDVAGATNAADKSRFDRSLDATAVSFASSEALFDGTADITEQGNFTGLTGASTATWAAWVKPDFVASASALPIVTQLTDVSNVVFDLSVISGGVRFRLRTDGEGGGGTTYQCIPGIDGCAALLTDNTWAHIAVTFELGTVSIYIDGVLVRVEDAKASPIAALVGSKLRIGSAPPNRFHGALRDVAIFDRKLNGPEIVSLRDSGPNGDAVELCDGNDQNCDGTADEPFASTLALSCDGLDGDLCTDGTTVCGGNGEGTRCLDTDAVGWWPLDGPTGVEAPDHGTLGMDGTLRRNTNYVVGKVGPGAADFGASVGISRIELGDHDPLAGTGKATWMAWIRPKSLTGTEPIITTYNPNGSPGPTWALERSTDGIALRLRTTASPTTKLVTCNSSSSCGSLLTVGAWTHVAVVADGGVNRFFIDGVFQSAFASGSGATVAAKKTNERLVIGGYSHNAPGFDGAIDDVRLYRTALNTAAIRAVYEKSIDVAALDPCDGVDNDCDGMTDEDYPTSGLACDGVDTDQCENGTWTCAADGRSVECINETETDLVEICNAADDDCDGATDEDFADAGNACDGPDGDACKEGIFGCTASGGLTCQNDGPLGLWRLDLLGTKAIDTAQDTPHTDLTINAAFWAVGKFGNALDFDGGSDGNARATLGIGGTRTLMMWVRPSAGGFVFGQAVGAGDVHFSAFWSGGALQYSHRDGSNTTLLTGSIPANQWHHVAVTMEPGDSVSGLKLYIDCVQVDARGLIANPASGEFTVGRLNGANQFFTGRVDEIALFDYAVPTGTICDYVATGIPAGNANRELCDGSDNNCSGEVDDGLTGKPTDACDGLDSDLCDNGTWTCRTDTLDVECINEAQTDIAEACNGLDDDCDGATDEDFQYQSEDIGFPCDPPGECGSGAVECINLAAAGCSTGPGGSTDESGGEFCDDKDNDCDGETDEKPDGTLVTQNCYTGPSGTLNVGECKFGQRTCVGGVFGACAGDITPATIDDECDDLDQNCNGIADEDWGDGIFCTADNCSGGVQQPVKDDSLCDTGNPCQNHICTADPSLSDGCQHTNNNTLIPDPAVYGKACNVAGCSGGIIQYSSDPSVLPDDGLTCTTDNCNGGNPTFSINTGTCLIDGVCYATGEVNLTDGCKVCAPTESKTSWSNLLARADFSASELDGYTIDDLSGGGVSWDADSLKTFSGSHALYFGNPATHQYDATGGARVHARATSPAVQIPAGIHIQATWQVWMETEQYTGSEKYDTLFLYLRDTTTGAETLVWDSMTEFGSDTNGMYRKAAVDLTDFAGQEVELLWEFDSGDAFFNDYEGVYLDEIRLRTGCCFQHGDCPTSVQCKSFLCVDNQCEADNFCDVCKRSQTSVVFGLDRSLSMATLHGVGVSRWDAVRSGLNARLAFYDNRVNAGVKLMSSTGATNVCDDVSVLLDLDFHSSAELIQSSLSVEPIEGGLSPIARTLSEINAAYATPAVQDETGNKYVIMVVDGGETCEDDDAVVLQLAALRGQDVRTIFIAFDSTWSSAQKDTMNTYALSGGLPVLRIAADEPVYLSAGTNTASFEAALDRALIMTISEACNGGDDDCDNDIDDNTPVISCNLDCNEGLGGVQTCLGGSYASCSFSAFDEICDGLDNNCDGDVDEDWPELGLPCSEGLGACFSTGVYQCNGTVTGNQVECNAPPVAGTTELCNGIDDDCDGVIDNGLQQPCSTLCGFGQATCVNGAYVNCDAEQPTIEVCNNLDDDCNGIVDDVVPIPCTGVCGTGFQVCVSGIVTGCTSDGSPELCNGLDDDCDGDTDEDVNGAVYTEMCTINNGLVGACTTGIRSCTLGVLGGCVPDQVAEPETCNGLDDDCDGQTDNVGAGMIVLDCYTGDAATDGIGECKKGTRTCLETGSLDLCVGEVLPADEVCDGLDNNCDGATDENPGVMCASQDAACAATGGCLCAQDQTGIWKCFLD